MTGEVWRGTAADLRRLLAVQRALSLSVRGSQRLARAQLLAAGGCQMAARADAGAAVADDPSDPLALLVLAQLSPDKAHDLGCQVIASPFASPAVRRAALPLLDDDRLPLVLPCDLAVSLRVTLVQRRADTCTLDGIGPDDLPQALGRDGNRHATDYFLARDSQAARTVGVTAGGILHPVEVAPLHDSPQVMQDNATAPLWIVMPVKDGGPALAACLGSLKENIAGVPGCRLFVVDDGSVQTATAQLLQSWRGRPGVAVMQTPRPLGFTGAVNLGLAAIGKGPVLLLNSDTILPPGTLRRMLAHLSDPTIGTVTPLTNNGGSFSVPVPRVAHDMPDAATCAAIAAEAAGRNRGVAVDVLTGNGFCMLIAEACLAATGALSQHYDSGYYEEVDFCLRARAHGFRHVAAADCFVGHVGSVSYGAARQRLVAANRRRIAARHPGYPADYMRFALADPLAPFRARLTSASTLQPCDLPAVAATGAALAVTLPGAILPVQGSATAFRDAVRPVSAAAHAAGLHLCPADSLDAAELALRPGHPLMAQPLSGGGLRVINPSGHRIADLTPGPAAAEVAGAIVAALDAAAAQAVDGPFF